MRAIAIPLALLVLAGTLGFGFAQDLAEEPPAADTPPSAEAPPMDEAPPVDEAPAAADLVNPNPLSSLTLDGLEPTRSLPLFTPSRTAPVVDAPVVEEAVVEAPVEAPVDPEQPPPPVELIGIVLTGSTQTALLRDTNTSEVMRLASGEEYESWMLKIVDARSIELRNGERVEALKMFESFPERAPSDPFSDPTMMGQDPTMMGQDPTMMGQDPQTQEIPADEGFGDPAAIPPEEIPMQEAEPPMPEEQIQPAEGFAPQPGEAPIPEEGAPAPEGNNSGNL